MHKKYEMTIEEKHTAIRSGFIRGGHAYEASDSPNYVPHKELPTPLHVEGFKMGWMSRLAAEGAGLEPSVLGTVTDNTRTHW